MTPSRLFYATLPAASFWLIHAAIAGGGALLVPIAQRPLRPVLAGAGAT